MYTIYIQTHILTIISSLPDYKSWDNVTNFPHHAGIKFILNLHARDPWINNSNTNQYVIIYVSIDVMQLYTHIQKKSASSKEFWNKMI